MEKYGVLLFDLFCIKLLRELRFVAIHLKVYMNKIEAMETTDHLQPVSNTLFYMNDAKIQYVPMVVTPHCF